MADLVIGISVEGAKEATAEITGVKTALGGVETGLDNNTAASGRLGTATKTVSGTQAEEAQAFRAATTENAAATSQANVRSTREQELHDKIYGTKTVTTEATTATEESTAATGLANVATGLFAAGVLAVVSAVSAWLEVGKEQLKNLQETNRALETLDFGAVTKQLQAAEGAATDYNTAWQALFSEQTSYGQTMAAIFAVIYANLKSGATEFTGAQASLTKEIDRSAEAVNKLFPATEQLKLSTAAITSTLSAENAELKRLGEQATNVDQLSATYAKQAVNIKDIADQRANQMIIDALATDKLLRAAGDIETADTRMGLVAKQANALRATAATDAANTIQQGHEKVAAAQAQEIETLGKINDLYLAQGEQAMKAGQAEVDARYKAAQANAQFFGTANTGVTAYYDSLQASITETGKLDLMRIEQTKNAEIAGLTVRRDALPLYSIPWQQLNDQIILKTGEKELALQTKNDETRVKLLENENAKVAAVRAAYADMISQADARYKTEAALGQGDVTQHLAFLLAKSNDDQLSLGQRQQYAVQAYQGYQKLDQDLFNLRKSLGLTTQTDEVQRLADLVGRTSASSEARIKAETEWATAATKLREDASNAGKTAIDKIAEALRNEGQEEVTLQDIVSQAGRIRAQTLTDTNRGLGLTVEEFKNANQLAGVWNELGGLGITVQQGVGAALDQTRIGLLGLRGPFADVGGDFSGLGEIANSLDPRLDSITTDFTEMGRNINTSLSTAYDAAITSTQTFFDNLDREIKAGASRTADRVYQGLIDRLKQALDAEAFAS